MIVRTSTLGFGLLAILVAGGIFTFYWIHSQTQDSFVLNSSQMASALGNTNQSGSQLALNQCVASLQSAANPVLLCPALAPAAQESTPQVAGEQIESNTPDSPDPDLDSWAIFALSYLLGLIK